MHALVQAPSARYSMMPAAMLPRCERIDDLRGRARAPLRRRPPPWREHRGRVEAALCTSLGATRPSGRYLDADRDAEQRRGPSGRWRSHAAARPHDHGARMHRSALERVVEILAVAAVPLTRAAAAALKVRPCPIAVQARRRRRPRVCF